MEKETLNLMFDNLLHIGNKTNFWNPKMKNYIFGSVNGIHVINLVKTQEKIEEVKKELKELHESGKKILFVGTKLQARDAVKRLATEVGHYYVAEKWVPWLLTNFKTIKRRISIYMQLDKDLKNWAFDMLTKKEKASKKLELEKLEKAYSWVKDMKKIPDVIFVVDWVYEEQALKEANSLNLISYAILSTNGDDTVVDNCIPANTNAVKSIEFVLDALKDSLLWKVVLQSWNKPQSDKGWNSKLKKVEQKKVSWEKKVEKKLEIDSTKEKITKSETLNSEETSKWGDSSTPKVKEQPKTEKKTTKTEDDSEKSVEKSKAVTPKKETEKVKKETKSTTKETKKKEIEEK